MDLSDAFNDSITVQSQTGSSDRGDPTWGTARLVPCVIRTVSQRLVSADGEVIRPPDVLITDQSILTGDRYWRPGDDTGNLQLARRFGTVRKQSTLDGDYTLYEVDV